MQSRKINSKQDKKALKPLKKVKDFDDDDDIEELKPPVDEQELEKRLTEEMPGESEVEDDEDFIREVENFKKEHANFKMIRIEKKLGNPKVADCSALSPDQIKSELRKIITLLDKHNIIVHFHNDYPDKEKYRFITSEIFRECIEKDSKSHIKFIYEDYHPEMDDDDEDHEEF